VRKLKTIADLQPDAQNANRGTERGVGMLDQSLRTYGAGRSIVCDRNGVVIAGNKTLECAADIGMDVEVVQSDGTRLVVVQRTDLDLAKDPKARELAYADNRAGEVGLDWDPAMLAADLAAGVDLDKFWLPGEMADVLSADPVQVGEDEAPEPQDAAISQTGDIWLLGAHRLMCGDSTNAGDVALLMAGEKADLCFTSPPYNKQRDYTKETKEKLQDWDGLMCGVFSNLPMVAAGQVLVNLGLIHRDGEWVPYWDKWIEWMRSQGWRRFAWYVWDQGFGLPGDWNGRLAPSFEFVFHFNQSACQPGKWIEKKPENIKARNRGESTMRGKDGKTKQFTNPAASGQATKIPDSIIKVGRQVGSDGHPAQFPVGLPAFMLQSWPGLIFDPFSGSGTTLIAAEQLNRRCYAMEIAPNYVDVAVRRWQKLTGNAATLEATGATFAQVETQRA